MEPLKWATTAESSAYMRMRQEQNRERCQWSRAEAWAKGQLDQHTPHKWTRQAQWGYRLYDFWCHTLGCAVEVDGPEHCAAVDAYQDEYHFRRSAIVVLRVPNFDEAGMAAALGHIACLGWWESRREQVGAPRSGGQLVKLPYPPHLLPDYLERHKGLAGQPWLYPP